MTQINGLPAHVLLVHGVVVLLPLAAVLTAVSALWPAARRRLGLLTPLAALAALALVPLTTEAGEWLEERLPESGAIEKHASLGNTLLPWAVGLFVLAALVWASQLRSGSLARLLAPVQRLLSGRAAGAVLMVAAVVVAAGAVVQVYRIGDSGAQAVWRGTGSAAASSGR